MAETPAKKTPHGLHSWKNHLRQWDLPVDPAVKAAVLQKLQSRSATASTVADLLQQDPALCLLLIGQANKALNKSNNEAFSLTHAVSLLGFPRTETLIRRAKVYDKTTFPQLAYYRQQLSVSLHAAHQAAGWAQLNPGWSQHYVFWPTLFQQAPLWALWYHAGEQMQQLLHLRAAHRGARHYLFEQQLFGTTLSALSESLSYLWHLPAATRQSWQPGASGTARQWIVLSRIAPEKARQALEKFPPLQHIVRSPAFLVAVSNRLAEEAEWNWYSNRTLRLQKIIATSSNKSLHKVIAHSHQHAITATRELRMQEIMHPAQQLVSFYNKAESLSAQLTRKTIIEEAVETAKATDKAAEETAESTAGNTTRATTKAAIKAAVSATNADKSSNPITALLLDGASAEFVQTIERLQQQPESFESIHAVMKLAVSSLCEHLSLERASASLLNLHSKELRTFYSSGCADSPALKNFSHKLQRGDLFNKLLQKPLSVRLHAGNYGQLWPLLPGHFKQACGADQFFMMSIFTHNKPVALIYADRGLTNRALDEQLYSHFKQLCAAVSACLQQLTDG